MYIGPQVLYTVFNTLLNAGRIELGIPQNKTWPGNFVSSGLGGMSGAQGRRRVASAVNVLPKSMNQDPDCHEQGWVSRRTDSLEEAVAWAQDFLTRRRPAQLISMCRSVAVSG